MKIDAHFPTETALPIASPMPAATARQELADALHGFISAAARVQPEDDEAPAPALALRVSPGLGKTRTALHVIADQGRRLLSRGNVLFYVPTLELAEEAQAEFARIAPSLPSAVIRGRSAARPDGAGPMCQRHELAAEVAKVVPFVSQALCADREGNVASCAEGCPYLAQRETLGGRVLFLAHAYLKLNPPIDREVPIALRVIDEAFWPALVSNQTLPASDLLKPSAKPGRQDDFVLGVKARATTLSALQAGLPVRAQLAEAGVDEEVLARLGTLEAHGRQEIEVTPDLSDAVIRKRLEGFDRQAHRASIFREKLFKLLAEDDAPDCERLSLSSRAVAGEDQDVVQLHGLHDLPTDAPLLMLDASADPRIIERMAPQARFLRIDAPAQAEVIQVADRVVSTAWLTTHAAASKHRQDIARMIRREVARAAPRRVLVVATRKVLAALHEDAGQPATDDADLEAPLHGADPRWFGPRMRGLNRFSDHATVLVIGRMQPGLDALEAQGRALFGDQGEPLLPLADQGLVERPSLRVMAGALPREVTVRTHPDPSIEAILNQLREESSLQAIARLRLMTPDRPKRVILIGSLPLPDLPVTRLTTFDALAEGLDGLETRRDLLAWRRLAPALRRVDGAPIPGLRLTAAGLAEDLPSGLMSLSQAKEFRRGRSSDDMLDLIARIAQANRWPCMSVELRAPGRGGHLAPAVVFASEQDAPAIADRLWPGLEAMAIRPLHA